MGSYRSSLLFVSLLIQGCAQELPGLPEANEDAPGAVEWVGLRGLEAGVELDPNAMPAGAVARVVLRVLDRSGVPFRGAAVTLSARADNYADLLRVPVTVMVSA